MKPIYGFFWNYRTLGFLTAKRVLFIEAAIFVIVLSGCAGQEIGEPSKQVREIEKSQASRMPLDLTDKELAAFCQKFPNIQSLHLSLCSKITTLKPVELLPKLIGLHASYLPKVGDLSPILELHLLKSLYFRDTYGVAFTSLTKLTTLEILDLSENQDAKVFAFSKPMPNLQILRLSKCSELQQVSGLSNCLKLQELMFNKCQKLKKLDGLESLSSLQILDLSNTGINIDRQIGSLTSLKALSLRRTNFSNTLALKKLTQLQWLDISYTAVSEVNSLKMLSKLKTLRIGGEVKVSDYSFLKFLPDLVDLQLPSTVLQSQLETICSNVPSLKKLRIFKAPNIDDLTAIEKIKGLEKLYLASCKQIVSISPLGSLLHLKELTMNYCTKLESVSDLGTCVSLETLSLERCVALKEIDGLWNLKELDNLNLGFCENVKREAIATLKKKLPKCRVKDWRGGPTAEEMLSESMKNLKAPESKERIYAAQRLLYLAKVAPTLAKKAISDLQDAKSDTDPLVRDLANQALKKLTPETKK